MPSFETGQVFLDAGSKQKDKALELSLTRCRSGLKVAVDILCITVTCDFSSLQSGAVQCKISTVVRASQPAGCVGQDTRNEVRFANVNVAEVANIMLCRPGLRLANITVAYVVLCRLESRRP